VIEHALGQLTVERQVGRQLRQFLFVWQFAIKQEVDDLFVRDARGKIVDVEATIGQNAIGAVNRRQGCLGGNNANQSFGEGRCSRCSGPLAKAGAAGAVVMAAWLLVNKTPVHASATGR